MAPDPLSWQSHSLRDYSFIADGERGGLIGPHGDLSWLCFPTWDSPAVMSGLLGGGGGYRLHPTGRVVGGGWFEERSLIWVQRWVTEDAEVECRSAFALPGRHGHATLLHRIKTLRGSADIDIALDIRAGFDRHKLRRATYDGVGWRSRSEDVHMLWTGIGEDVEQAPTGALTAQRTLGEGGGLELALVLSTEPDIDVPDCDELWAATRDGWKRRVPSVPSKVTSRDSEHAYAVLTAMTADTGGTIAAATLGLPEKAGGGRSFDYRYVWIRDLCYVGQAVALGDQLSLLDGAVRFVIARIEQYGETLAPAYRTDGSPVPDEQPLALSGYPGDGGGVVGNWVNKQFQLDAWGEILLLFAAADEQGRLGADGWEAAEKAAAVIAERWREDDAGIWELDPAPWTHSKLMCAAGLRTIARRPTAVTNAGRWVALADEIVADTSRTSLHRTGRWQRSPDDPRIDAALLLPGLRGAVAVDDPRTLATLEAVLEQLTHDGYAYRFRHGDSPLGRTEGAFMLCAFLVSEALEQQGRHEEAARWYERTRAACGTPGLFTEELDVKQRQLRGNLPQAFVHAMLLRLTLLQDRRLNQ